MDFFEQLLSLRGYPINAASIHYSKIKSLKGEEFENWQRFQKWEIVRYHRANNSFYSNLAREIVSDDWNSLPIITKQSYQGQLTNFISDPFKYHENYLANTSGSSGHPFYFAKDKYAHALAWALIKQKYMQAGISFGDLQGRFYGIPLENGGYWFERLKDWTMNRIRFPVFDLSDDRLEDIRRRIITRKVRYLYGYTSAIVHFARYLIRNGIVLNEQNNLLKACIVTSEVCSAEDRTLLKQALGVKIINEYGSSELGIMAFEDDNGNMVGSDELMYFEVLENGELLCTSLFNKAFPIIRYKIGDLAELEKRDGRTIFKSLLGRTNDIIRLPSGRTAAGLTFYYISRSILESSGVLREFIIRQTKLDVFEFDIVAEKKLGVKEEKLIKSKTELYLEKGLTIKFNYTNKIVRPSSGKIKHFYSLVDDKN